MNNQDHNKQNQGGDMNKQQSQQNQGNKQQGGFQDNNADKNQQQQDRTDQSGQQGGFQDKSKQDMGGKGGSAQNR